ncbi:uncharacterized protein [Lolium perenne]|uniref:uncharacterized protein n=1 Tax=Lolium perenne TaxID=4522 RepID=UPI0021F587B4|nr:uncharacterized protein LOC127302885 [Lolium perenne]
MPMEGDGGRAGATAQEGADGRLTARTPLTQGVIVDETPQVVPCVVVSTPGGRLYMEVVTTRLAEVCVELTVHPDPHPVLCPVRDEVLEADLRRRALLAAIARAYTVVNQYVFFFTREDQRFRGISIFHPLHGPESLSQRSSLIVADGFGVPGGNPPGMTFTGRTDMVANAFAQHCLAGIQGSFKARDAVPQLSRSMLGRLPFACQHCRRPLWFGPCCLRTFCRVCENHPTHMVDCDLVHAAVRMMPPFLLENGQQPPGEFDRLPHPLWCLYRYVSGDRYTLVSYFQVVDAHYYQRDTGIRFATHLYRRGSPTRWIWCLELTFTILRDQHLHITWRVHLADEFDTWRAPTGADDIQSELRQQGDRKPDLKKRK